MPVYTTACPRNCYSTCTMQVEVENGQLRRIEPHPGNLATAEGPCLKGLSYVERAHSPERILFPMRRTSGGSHERITWDQALDAIAQQLIEYRKQFGPQSIFFYSASGTKGLVNSIATNFWRLYGGCTTTYGDLCWPAGLEATRLTLGENKHNAPWDIARARLIVMWGKNAAETNIHQTVFIDQAIEAGAKIIVIDPRRTETAERAHLLIQPRPGTDGAIALAVANRLIENDHVDHGFIQQNVKGFEELAEQVRAFTPERAASIAGVNPKDISKLADLIGNIKPVTINAGFGMQRYTNSGQTMRAMIALLAITGNIGKPGAGWVFANLQGDIFDTVKDPIALYPPAKPDGVFRISVSTARLGKDMLAQRNPKLAMAWVERGNPIPQNPETHTVIKAFRELGFRVVVEQFWTDTAREADIVLPAKTMFEQSDVIWGYWHPYIQLKQKMLEPPGEVRPESEVYWYLARRIGLTESQLAGLIPPPGDEAIEDYLAERLRPFPGLTLQQLRQGPLLAPGCQEVVFSDLVFPTQSGKIEIVSHEAAERWGVDLLPGYTEPMESTGRPSLESERYPFYLMTPNTKNRIHSQFNNLRMIRKLSPKPYAQIHPADAILRGIEDGARIRVYNARGSFEVEARYDHGIRRSCIAVTNGWWIGDGGAVNVCSLGRETDMGHGAAFHDNLVQVERVT